MRCLLVAACALAAWPCYGQQASPITPVDPRAAAAGESVDSLESILLRLERLESENATLRERIDALPAPPTGIDEQPAAMNREAWPDDGQDDITLCECHCPECLDRQRNGRNGNGSAYPTLTWSGFLQLDTGWVSQDAANVAAVGDIEAQTGLRRVRLRASGRVRRDVSYVVDLDFAASGHPSFRDVKFTLHDRPVVQNLAIGYFQQPFGLDAMSSGRDLVLMERQLPYALAPFRQTGVRAHGTALDNMVTWSHAVFAYPTDSFGVNMGDRGGCAYAGRLTALAFDDPRSRALVHVGGSYSFQDPGNDLVRYAIEPGFFVTDPTDNSASGRVPAFVDTGDIPTQNVNLAGAELVGLLGPLNMQIEATRSLVNPDAGPSLGFSAASAKIGLILTGESHAYHRRRGVVGGVTPFEDTSWLLDCTGGAWEVTAGWAWIDLNDETVEGGEMQTAVVGLNRYLHAHTKFQINVIRALLDESDNGRSAATVVALRAHAEF